VSLVLPLIDSMRHPGSVTDATRRRLEPLARAQEALRINRPVTPISVNPR
jgi:hypothetical protein